MRVSRKFLAQDLLALLAAPFFPLFFVPLARIGGAALEANFVAALLLSCCAILNANILLNNKFIRIFVLLPWLLLFCNFVASTIIVGPRVSFIPFFSQCVFLLAACGLAATVSRWFLNGSKFFSIFLGLMVSSYFVALFQSAAPSDFWGIWSNLFTADVWSLIVHARRAFNPNSFAGTLTLDALANNHNRIAQQTFSLGFFILVVALFSGPLISKLLKILYMGFAGLMIWLSLFLMSGQSMGQMLLTFLYCVGLSVYLKPSAGKILLIVSLPIAILGVLIFMSQTDFGEAWRIRLTSGNIDTGRVVRWIFYWNESPDWTIFGRTSSLPIDPHNMVVSIFFEIGIFGILLYFVFLIAIISKPFFRAKIGYERFGLGYLMALSVGVQMLFVMMIAGGYGYPGWAEMSKFCLFLLATLMMSKSRPEGIQRPLPDFNR